MSGWQFLAIGIGLFLCSGLLLCVFFERKISFNLLKWGLTIICVAIIFDMLLVATVFWRT